MRNSVLLRQSQRERERERESSDRDGGGRMEREGEGGLESQQVRTKPAESLLAKRCILVPSQQEKPSLLLGQSHPPNRTVVVAAVCKTNQSLAGRTPYALCIFSGPGGKIGNLSLNLCSHGQG